MDHAFCAAYSAATGRGWCLRVVTDRHPCSEPSPALLEAQERLVQLRKRIVVADSPPTPAAMPGRPAGHRPACKPAGPSVADAPAEMAPWPPHLGWHSRAVTDAVRRDRRRGPTTRPVDEQPARDRIPRRSLNVPQNDHNPAPDQPLRQNHGSTVRVYPDIALGMLRQGEAAPGRVWLLLRYLDQGGKGWLCIDTVKNNLTNKSKQLRICGWRQLRKLLNRGEGIFWTRNGDRIWLHSAARVAAALEVDRLAGKPVATPIAGLLQGMGAVRAHLYASFHSGRVRTSAPGPGGLPVARATLERVTGVCRRSQRAYERRAGIKVQHNFAVGERDSPAGAQRRAWLQGHALFKLKDHRGQHGREGDVYLAWQLPNSYSGCHRQLPKGRQRRINRELADLFKKERTGNGKNAYDKRYYARGKLAAEGYNRDPHRDLYWPEQETTDGTHRVWRVLTGMD